MAGLGENSLSLEKMQGASPPGEGTTVTLLTELCEWARNLPKSQGG